MNKIYLASPYSLGDMATNVRISMEAANELINEGFAPYCPLLSHFQQLSFPQEYDIWMSLDLEWISVCDAMLRLPGESSGADREVEFARNNSIPVFYDLRVMIEYFNEDDDEISITN